MRLETRHQQQTAHLQLQRTQNGKFLVSSSDSNSHRGVGPYHHHHHHHRHHNNNNNNNNSNSHHHSSSNGHYHQQHERDSTQQQQQLQQYLNYQTAQLQQLSVNDDSAGLASTSAAAAAAAAAASAAAVTDKVEPGDITVIKPQDQQGLTILADRFLLLGPTDGSTLFKCIDVQTNQHLVAKALTMGDKSTDALLQAHLRLEGTCAASGVAGLVDAGRKRYLLLEGHHGDLHAYVRARRRLREPEARRLFAQAAKAVSTCHKNGVVLRDLKLRKFVFADEMRTKLRLESLEDAVLVDEDNDRLSDRRGCPAYVAPEVLRSGRAYSGKAADIWSLGVLLYTMLVGRYPFNDVEHASLFAKISRGTFAMPDVMSPRARCLVRALLRREPSERPASEDVLRHPWLSKPLRSSSQLHSGNGTSSRASPSNDQLVPNMPSSNGPSSASQQQQQQQQRRDSADRFGQD